MSLWQVRFTMLPQELVAGYDILPDEIAVPYLEQDDGPRPVFTLPADFEAQAATLFPPQPSSSPDLLLWGQEGSDEIQIRIAPGGIASIGVRIDVRKVDDMLLMSLLALSHQWSCLLVESHYLQVCRFGLDQLRRQITGHPHYRAMKDPQIWLPALSKELRRREEPR